MFGAGVKPLTRRNAAVALEDGRGSVRPVDSTMPLDG